MSATQDCEQIEKCIKDILFKGLIGSGSPSKPDDINPLSHQSSNPSCFVSDIEKTSNPAPRSPFRNVLSTDNLVNNPGTSKLIDLNVLNDFAAKHINDPSFNSSLALGSQDVPLPHPDLEDDCNNPCLKNGEQPGISVLLNNITKEIQNSPNFLNMPDNPLQKKPLEAISKRPSPKIRRNQLDAEAKAELKRKKKALKKEKKKGKLPTQRDGNDDSPKLQQKGANSKVNSAKKRDESSEKVPTISVKKGKFSAFQNIYSIELQENHYRFHCSVCSYSTDVISSINSHMNSRAHCLAKEQKDLDLLLPFLPDPLPNQAEVISELLYSLILQSNLNEEDLNVRKSFYEQFKESVEKLLPGSTLTLVGSTAFGCGLKCSEVDLMLTVEDSHTLPQYLEQLYDFMTEGSSYCNVMSEFKAKRPYIRFIDKATSLRIVLHVDNASICRFADITSTYFKLDDRALALAKAIWYWAKICKINDQIGGTFPSYSYSLLVIHFLQQVEPPVLPVLPEVEDFEFTPEFNADFVARTRWKSENTNSLGVLWLKFFRYYNFEYKLGLDVVTIRTSKRMLMKDRKWTTKFYGIEDPLTKRNVAFVIPNFATCNFIQQCFSRTYKYFGFPRLKNGEIKLKTDETFDSDLFDLLSTKPEIEEPVTNEEDTGESVESDSEDSDQLAACQALEDHDPDIPVGDFVTAMSKLSLQDSTSESSTSKDTTAAAESLPSDSKSDSPVEREPGKGTTSAQNKIKTHWDIEGREIAKSSFRYEFKAVLFKGEKDPPVACKNCKSSRHLKEDCPEFTFPEQIPLPVMIPEFVSTITKVLCYIKEKNAVNKADIDRITDDMRDIEQYIRNVFPEAKLKLFGSCCNGFGFKNKSDMDFCLTFKDCADGKGLDSSGIIENVAKELNAHPELSEVLAITSAKVPIVKFTWSKTNLEGDISLYNTLAISNTELLETYSRIDTRVQILGYALKYFAKILGICDASKGSLSSYAYILMVIYFLQQRDPPVIPVLQELCEKEKPETIVDGCNVWFFKDVRKLKDVWPDYGKNKESVGALWIGLLCYYAYDFKWQDYVISIKQKKALSKFRKLWNTTELAIEDPFDLHHNLGAGLSRKMNTYIIKAFIKARERFGTPAMEKFKVGKEIPYLFNIHFLNSGVVPPHDRGCSNCGKIGHKARNCTVEKACSICRRLGHLRNVCPWRRSKTAKERENSFDAAANRDRDMWELQMARNANHNRRPDPQALMRTFPGMQLPQPIGNPIESQKLLQKGVPTHRLPPPGFAQIPPPGFMPPPMAPPSSVNYPPPFNNPRMHAPPPFGCGKNEMHAQSPPKHYSSSPPKAFGNKGFASHPWSMGGPQGYQVERHPSPQMPRGVPADRLEVLPGARNVPRNRYPIGQGPPRHPWNHRPFQLKEQFPHPKSNHPNDHRHLRTKSDLSYNPSDSDRY